MLLTISSASGAPTLVNRPQIPGDVRGGLHALQSKGQGSGVERYYTGYLRAGGRGTGLPSHPGQILVAGGVHLMAPGSWVLHVVMFRLLISSKEKDHTPWLCGTALWEGKRQSGLCPETCVGTDPEAQWLLAAHAL